MTKPDGYLDYKPIAMGFDPGNAAETWTTFQVVVGQDDPGLERCPQVLGRVRPAGTLCSGWWEVLTPPISERFDQPDEAYCARVRHPVRKLRTCEGCQVPQRGPILSGVHIEAPMNSATISATTTTTTTGGVTPGRIFLRRS